MQRCLDFWYGLTARGRVALWLALMCCFTVILWWVSLRPQDNRLAQLKRDRDAQQISLRQHYMKTYALRPPERVAESEPVQAFSPLDFTPPHARLTRWQPAVNGGELVLSAQWTQAIDTFARLADREMVIRGFSLAPEGEQLRFTLQLEAANDH